MDISPSTSCPSEEDSFVWDDNSQLYYHARCGFYHDPTAGWYYNGRDGLYYSFYDGQYVLLDANNKGDRPVNFSGKLETSATTQAHEDQLVDPVNSRHCECASSMVEDEHKSREDVMVDSEEAPDIPPPTSEWLEDTLIDLFLSHNSAREAHLETDNREDACNAEQEGDCSLSDISWEEENWKAQYGQSVHHEEEEEMPLQHYKVTDLWDWAIIQEHKPEKFPIARLVGRLVQPSTKVHPSMPSGGKRLKTSPIYRVHLDLVQVKSGQLYRLRSPGASYLATLSLYNASDPTKDWGFPEISREAIFLQSSEPQTSVSIRGKEKKGKFDNSSSQYRDRAAERRALHGAFSFGPGDKTSMLESSSPPDTSLSSEEAAAEALEMSLGPDSYAQKILKNMGWKEGHALGKTGQGLTSPLQVVGNKGNAGLGYLDGRR